MSYLVIVRKTKNNQWVIDKDSYHIFEDDGGNYPDQEITISQIRALAPTDGEEAQEGVAR